MPRKGEVTSMGAMNRREVVGANENLEAYRQAIKVFNDGNGDLSAITDLLADDVVHYTPAPEVPMLVGKQAWLEGARLTVERAGWTRHEILSESGADDFTQAV